MAADQLKQARQVIKDFVLEMRSGKRMMVLAPTGQLKTTTCSLTKRLDTFRIVRSNRIRRIPLTDIQTIHAGLELEGMRTPLDDLCATMVVATDGALITFRFEHINARDTFVMCMMLFAQSLASEFEGDVSGARGGGQEGEWQEGEGDGDWDEDGAGDGQGGGEAGETWDDAGGGQLDGVELEFDIGPDEEAPFAGRVERL